MRAMRDKQTIAKEKERDGIANGRDAQSKKKKKNASRRRNKRQEQEEERNGRRGKWRGRVLLTREVRRAELAPRSITDYRGYVVGGRVCRMCRPSEYGEECEACIEHHDGVGDEISLFRHAEGLFEQACGIRRAPYDDEKCECHAECGA